MPQKTLNIVTTVVTVLFLGKSIQIGKKNIILNINIRILIICLDLGKFKENTLFPEPVQCVSSHSTNNDF